VLEQLGAEIIAPPSSAPNGHRLVARHPDGASSTTSVRKPPIVLQGTALVDLAGLLPGHHSQPTEDQPPSEAMTWPVIQPASSLRSQAIRRAVSAGVLQRPPGFLAITAAVVSVSA